MTAAMIAFCACSRFSAWSKTTELRPVEHLVGDLLAPVRRQAVHDARPAGRPPQQVRVHLVVAETLRRRFSASASWPMLVQVSV